MRKKDHKSFRPVIIRLGLAIILLPLIAWAIDTVWGLELSGINRVVSFILTISERRYSMDIWTKRLHDQAPAHCPLVAVMDSSN